MPTSLKFFYLPWGGTQNLYHCLSLCGPSEIFLVGLVRACLHLGCPGVLWDPGVVGCSLWGLAAVTSGSFAIFPPCPSGWCIRGGSRGPRPPCHGSSSVLCPCLGRLPSRPIAGAIGPWHVRRSGRAHQPTWLALSRCAGVGGCPPELVSREGVRAGVPCAAVRTPSPMVTSLPVWECCGGLRCLPGCGQRRRLPLLLSSWPL